MRALAIVLLSIAAAAPLSADEPQTDAAKVRAKLASVDPKDVAWGLHDAIVGRVSGLDDEIRHVVTRTSLVPGEWNSALRTLAIDAVIESDVELPDGALHKLASDAGPARTLLLAAKHPAGMRDLLRPLLTTARDDDAWLAACNLLLTLRDSVLAAHLVGLFSFEGRILVVDSDDIGLGGGAGGSFGSDCGQVGRALLAGWPRRSYWLLRESRSPGDRLVAKGPRTIYAERREVFEGDFACQFVRDRGWRSYAAPEYLAVMLRLDVTKLRNSLSEYRSIRYTDAESWAKEIDDVRRTLTLRWLEIAHACWHEGLLSPLEVTRLSPHITITVDDQRKTKVPALPPIPNRRPGT